jgi:hypothetical protein
MGRPCGDDDQSHIGMQGVFNFVSFVHQNWFSVQSCAALPVQEWSDRSIDTALFQKKGSERAKLCIARLQRRTAS